MGKRKEREGKASVPREFRTGLSHALVPSEQRRMWRTTGVKGLPVFLDLHLSMPCFTAMSLIRSHAAVVSDFDLPAAVGGGREMGVGMGHRISMKKTVIYPFHGPLLGCK